jgi:hypothetical protein
MIERWRQVDSVELLFVGAISEPRVVLTWRGFLLAVSNRLPAPR